jgi:hypothetical protein
MEGNSPPGVLRTINDAFTLLRVVVGAWTAAFFVSSCKSFPLRKMASRQFNRARRG